MNLTMGDAMDNTGAQLEVMVVAKVHAPSLTGDGGALRQFLTPKGVDMSPSAPHCHAVRASREAKERKEREPKLCRNAWELWTAGRRPGGGQAQRGGSTHALQYQQMTADEKIAYLREYTDWVVEEVGRPAFRTPNRRSLTLNRCARSQALDKQIERINENAARRCVGRARCRGRRARGVRAHGRARRVRIDEEVKR